MAYDAAEISDASPVIYAAILTFDAKILISRDFTCVPANLVAERYDRDATLHLPFLFRHRQAIPDGLLDFAPAFHFAWGASPLHYRRLARHESAWGRDSALEAAASRASRQDRQGVDFDAHRAENFSLARNSFRRCMLVSQGGSSAPAKPRTPCAIHGPIDAAVFYVSTFADEMHPISKRIFALISALISSHLFRRKKRHVA